ncbi:hypothetical protein CLOM_g486 [Closterium sp. NIES-68]|nr:hypothetical protein CLOM_g486 [Closterium sp. NIES-68]
MKQKAGDAISAAKEKMSEVSAKTGEAMAKGKAEVQESVDKARHPTSREARAVADAKEAQRKERAELEAERKVAGAMEREAAEKEARREKQGLTGTGATGATGTGHQGGRQGGHQGATGTVLGRDTSMGPEGSMGMASRA